MIFPRSGVSLRPAGLVFTKVPNVIDAFERMGPLPIARHRLARKFYGQLKLVLFL